MATRRKLGELQLAIMRRLWETGEATVSQVHESLRAERGLALTTIATMLRKMEAKGVVSHRADGRQFVYRPLVAEREVHRSMVGELTDLLFGGDSAALVSHLLLEQELDAAEIARLKRLIASHERDRKGASHVP